MRSRWARLALAALRFAVGPAHRTIGRHAATAALREALVASVRPWSAASYIVDTAAGHEADSHDSDNGRQGPTDARRAAGRWRFAASTRSERAGLSVHLQMECRRARQAQSGRTSSSRHTPPSAHKESMPGVHLSGRTRCYWSDAQSGDVLLTLLLVETRCRCHRQNTRFAPGLFSLVARPSFSFREPYRPYAHAKVGPAGSRETWAPLY